jgi:hypothetical protein
MMLRLVTYVRAQRRLRRFILALPLLLLFAAVMLVSESPLQLQPPRGTPLPTYDARDTATVCAELNAVWGKDWPRVILDLEKLRDERSTCGGQDPALTLYPAYYNYGAALEARGDLSGAIIAYRKALETSPKGTEAARALQKYGAFTPTPLETCSDAQVQASLSAVPAYVPRGTGAFTTIEGSAFTVNGQPYRLRGINYYPARAPWRRFLLEADPAAVAGELDLIAGAGFNTLRIFLWYDALFACPGSGAVPRPDAFARLDTVIRLAAERKLRLIVTLNDLPDLVIHPLYADTQAAPAQTAYLVRRYAQEPAILAWDVRNEGDIDYMRGNAPSVVVLDWLRRTTAQIRPLDPNHLITAGWNEDAQATESAVDFVSFHHWSTPQKLQQRLDTLRSVTQKPVLLEEVGYSTFGGKEADQSASLRDVLTAAESSGVAGWLIWTAFDFSTEVTCWPPACPSQDNGEHHFGLWRTDYSPKPALDALKALINP